MITLSNVSKNYGVRTALQHINLRVDSGEMVFITGHSGAGKTTLLKLISMIEPISAGQIYVNDVNITRIRSRRIARLRRDMGMIFQNPQLIPTRSVFENVAMPLYIAGFRPKEIKRRTHAALDKVGLLNKEKCLPPMLSSGEQQRTGIARAVVNKPSLLLADEPTGNVDPELSKDIMRLFEAFNEVGVTVLVATHDLALIAAMNHRILALRDGKLLGE